jgi:hypothetical protein
MKCALTKILPFILTLCAGLALGNFSGRLGWYQVRDKGQETPGNTRQGRTWLVIHQQPHPSFPEEAGETERAPCSVRLRVRFDVDGKVSKAIPEDSDAPEDCVAAATVAARRIVFTPASENGKPVAVVARVSYGFGEMRVRVMDEEGRLSCLTSRHPIASPIELLSVEGAEETEGWRVVYE